MIGIGPLITIPLVLATLHGPLSLAGWIAGALLALCDGLVWAELGAAAPGSGGTYRFLREAFLPASLGAFFAFLFVWQMLFAGPLLLASGYVGFANYACYLSPSFCAHPWAIKTIAAAIGAVTLVSLFRPVRASARAAVYLGLAALATLAVVAVAAYAHFDAHTAFALDPHDAFWPGLAGGLASALVITMYDYAGYGQAAAIGDEIVAPARMLPRAVVISIALVATFYVALQVGVLGAMPWRQLDPNFPGSQIVAQAFGHPAGVAVTLLILVTAFASVYGNLLGFSRIPYAAALDGNFLAPFARVHPRLHIPTTSLAVVGVLGIVACAFSLDQLIAALTAALVLVQSIAQIAAVFALRARGETMPFRMPLFPLPALVALAGWVLIFLNAGTGAIVFGCVSIVAGAAVYLLAHRR